MTREEAHNLVNQLFNDFEKVPDVVEFNNTEEAEIVETAARVLPEGKRVVRTKSSGDRVYLLDEVKKTRHWVTSPEILKAQGFVLEDVTEVEDQELLKYQMAAALYRVEA